MARSSRSFRPLSTRASFTLNTSVNQPATGLLLAAAAGALWGTIGIAGTFLNRIGMSGMEVAAVRILLASPCLLFILTRIQRAQWQRIRAHAGLLLAHAICGVFLYNVTYFMAVRALGPAYAVSLLYTAPFWVLVFGVWLLRERVTARRITLAVMALLGVACLVAVSPGSAPVRHVDILIGLASGMFYALYTVLGRRLVAPIGAEAVLAVSFLGAALCFVFMPATWSGLRVLVQHGDLVAWVSVLTLSLVATVLAFYMYNHALKTITAATGSVLVTLEPCVAVVLAALLFGDHMHGIQYAGLLLVILTSIASARIR